MDFCDIVPRHLHETLKWFGKLGESWLRYEQGSGSATRLTPVREVIEQRPDCQKYLDKLHDLVHVTGTGRYQMTLAWIDAMGSVLAKGPKLFQPTAEQYDAMQHVDLNIPIADYRQPYPAFVIRIPHQSKINLAKELNMDVGVIPHYTVMHLRKTVEDKNLLYISQSHWKEQRINCSYLFQDRVEFKVIEDAITRCFYDPDRDPLLEERDFIVSERMARAGINLSLMLTHYGIKPLAPLHPKEYHKHRSKKALEHLATADFLSIEMKQNIVIRDARSILHHEEPVPSGREMPPHWRRGHWRNQHWGPGNQYRKLTFIKPMLIRVDRVVGDIGDSEAIYRGK